MKNLAFWLLILLSTAWAALLRLPGLERRPMHCDEAVHADKLGTLLEGGGYRYDPSEYHGPTLNYFTLLPAWIRGVHRYTDLSEALLRSVPALFGLLLVPLLLLWKSGLGLPSVAAASCLLAVSPVMAYYSRYYIQEMLLLFFSCAFLACGYRFFRSARPGWLLLSGLALGLSHATKETFCLSLAAAAASLVICVRRPAADPSPAHPAPFWRSRHLVAFLLAALLSSVVFYSSFFSHWPGVIDSVRAYFLYLVRIHDAALHTHPWYYYLQTILFFREPGGPVWTEGFIFLFGCLGLWESLSRHPRVDLDRTLLRFLGLYTIFLTALYAAIAYKTPWCLIQFWLGWILLAGVGTIRLYRLFPASWYRGAVIWLFLLGAGHLGWQSWRACFPMDADPRNPFVYAHTGPGVFSIVRRVEAIAKAHPDGIGMPVQVYSRENLWPLPWYLRRFPKARWWTGFSDQAANAPLILATPDMEAGVVHKLYEIPPPGERELYMRMLESYTELRPQVEVRGYVARSLWEDYLRREAEEQGERKP